MEDLSNSQYGESMGSAGIVIVHELEFTIYRARWHGTISNIASDITLRVCDIVPAGQTR